MKCITSTFKKVIIDEISSFETNTNLTKISELNTNEQVTNSKLPQS